MKAKLWIVVTCLITHSVDGAVFQFASMVNFKSRISANKFLGYGNYCGMGGKGETMDVIDRCCREHDRCIEIANKRSCLPFAFLTYYILPYTWVRTSDGDIYCSNKNSRCAMAYCNCDRDCAECFAGNYQYYNRRLKRGMLKRK
ncbi:hypothetical protein ACF0H5_000966 [Mactra antiquata]